MSLLYIGDTAATNSPVFNASSLYATPHDSPFRQQVKVPSTMSKARPIMSPTFSCCPYFWPLELLLCRSSPLYIPQPLVVSQKAYSRLTSGRQTPILSSCPLLIKISKQYRPPGVNIYDPRTVLKPLPAMDWQIRLSSYSFSLLLVFYGFHENTAQLVKFYVSRNHRVY